MFSMRVNDIFLDKNVENVDDKNTENKDDKNTEDKDLSDSGDFGDTTRKEGIGNNELATKKEGGDLYYFLYFIDLL